MVSSAYLRLLILLPAILIPAYDSSCLAFCMMYSTYKLNNQGDNIQPWHTPLPIWNQSVVQCLVLTVASWPAYRIHRRQVRLSGISISLSVFHNLMWSTQGFSVVNEAEVDVFLEWPCFFMIQHMLAIWFLVPLPFLNPVCTYESPQFIYCWSLAWRILTIILIACEMNATVW